MLSTKTSKMLESNIGLANIKASNNFLARAKQNGVLRLLVVTSKQGRIVVGAMTTAK